MITLMNANCTDEYQKQDTLIYGISSSQKLNTEWKLFSFYGITMLLIRTDNINGRMRFCFAEISDLQRSNICFWRAAVASALRQWAHLGSQEWVTCNGRQLCWKSKETVPLSFSRPRYFPHKNTLQLPLPIAIKKHRKKWASYTFG